MRSSATRLLFVIVLSAAFRISAQSSDPFALTPPLISQAITSCGDLTVSSGLIDSSPTAHRGNVLTNGNVKVSGGTVDGDAIAGPGKTVTRSGSGTITGSIASATTAFPCSIIDLGALSATLASANDNATIPLSAQHKNPVSSAGDFTLSGGDSLTLQAGTYYFHKFTMSGGSTITLAGPVRILATSDVNVSGGSIAGANQWQLHFWSSATTKFVVSSSTFEGFIYAPSAVVTVSSGTVVGGVFGGTVTVSGSSHVTRTIDSTPPVVTIISPLDHEAVVDLSQVAVRGTVSDSETAITSFQVNGSDVAVASDGSFTVTLNLSSATPPAITATATNAAGLSSTSTVRVQSAITRLDVSPTALTIDQNAMGQLAAIGTYADGTTAEITPSATWTSSAPSIATVSAGTVTGVSPGTVTISATLGSFSASATVTVNPLLQSIAVTPSTATVATGAKQAFTATGTYSDGSTKNLTSGVTWTSSDTGLASVDATGIATALSAGTVTIRGALGTIGGSATLTVLATPTITSVQPTRGRTSGGDTVTITGTNFGTTNNTGVTFGGFTASVTSANATTITVTTPSHAAGTVDVSVTAPTGTATTTGAFTYLAPPTITSIAPNRGKTSGGDSITVTGSNFDMGGTTLKIGSTAATNVVVTSPTSLTATTPAGTAGVASVTVTTAGGSGTLTSGFTYVPPPAITSFTPAQGPVGTSVTINGTNFDATAANDVVIIGGAPAVITSATTTRLIANVAATAVTGPVSVSTAFGTATTATNFTVLIYRSLAFTSSATAIQIGHQLQFSASVTKFDNTSFDVSSSAVWTSSDTNVATVSPNGLVIAGSAGATDVTAAFSGLTATVHLAITTPVSLPPPTIQGPPLDPTIVTPIADTIRFLYTGPNAIQTGVAPNAIADNRAAVVSGRVLDVSGAPLPGVVVTTGQHPELGQTVTRADGRYDFVWNGGGPLHLVFTKSGYISADRMVTTKWNQQKPVDDVVLVAYDGAVATITTGAAAMQVAQGSVVTDNSGTRRATILFPAGTTATLTNADGTTTAASTLNVRATEFTVGANGPKAMPALLPPNSGYTYCVELSVDEAPGVTFSNPLPVYVDNFINFPVGTPVPVGYFDRSQQKWLPAANGVVIKILTVANGTATIDSNGDGIADNALGLSGDELVQLANLYTAGQTLWRVQVGHFSSWDCNWPFGPPSDAVAPNLPKASARARVCKGCKMSGSIVDVENQELGESIPISGTSFKLEYDSGRTDRAQYQMNVPVTGGSVPASLQGITVEVSIAGRAVVQQITTPTPNQTLNFTWDGLDAYGRPIEGARVADVSVTYTYPARYRPPQSSASGFDAPPAGTIVIGDRTRATISFAQATEVTLGQVSASGAGFGGWSFSAQHAYDASDGVVYLGTSRSGGDLARNGEIDLYRVAGTGNYGYATGGAAAMTAIGFPTSIAPRPDGGFYFVDTNYAIYLVDPNGNLSVVAGAPSKNPPTTLSSDGVPAVGAAINPLFIALDPNGTIYFSEPVPQHSDRIRRIANGLLETVAGGTATTAPLGDNGPALAANLTGVDGLAIAPDGVIYVATTAPRVRRISLDGVITTVAGGGSSSADNIPATQANVDGAQGVAVGPDGTVYFCADFRIAHVTPDGFIHYLTGTGAAMQDGDVAATRSTNGFPWGISVANDGTVFFSERSGGHDRVWSINGGIAHVVAGASSGSFALTPIGSLARAGNLSYLYDVKIAGDGTALIADADQFVIEKTARGVGSIVASDDGTIGYVFEGGRHTKTVSTVTGTTLETLAYDLNGYLISVTDVNGQVTTIERDASGVPSAIVAPGGQRTTLLVGAQGLTSIRDPAGQSFSFQYNSLGLLSQMTDTRGGLHKFTYDFAGNLVKDEDPAGGFLTLTPSGSSTNFAILRGTAEGRSSTVGWQQNSYVLTTRPTVGSDGLVTTRLENGDGSTSTTTPAGVILSRTVAADSRFGMIAPVTATVSIQMPSGLKLSAASSRQVTLADPTNVLSVSSFVETLAINGRTFRSRYSSSSRTTALTTPAGRTESTVLDARDRPVSMQIPGLTAVAVGYESHGLLSSLTAGARQTSFSYDDHHRIQTITDSLGRQISFGYDSADRVILQTLQDGHPIAFSYDAAGNVTSVTTPAQSVHGFTFTPLNLLATYVAPQLANVTSPTTTYSYNRDRQPTTVLRPGGATVSLGYDSAGRLSTVTEPLGVHQYAYDSSSGMLASVSAPDGNGLQFTYDGDLLRSVTWRGVLAASVGLTYDTSFRLTSQNVNGANLITFGYDNDDLLVTAGMLTLRRDSGNGLLTGTNIGNLTDSYGYNEFGEVISYGLQLSASPIFSRTYTRDNGGRISAVTESSNGQTTVTSYGYDTAGRLSDVTTGSSTTHYGYDDNGNRISITSTAGTIVATYDAQDRITTYNGASYFYSDNGELQKKIDSSGTTQYLYDTLGNLREVSLPNGNVIDYVIDAANRRVGKKVNGTLVTGWIYGNSLQIIAETDGSGTVTKRFVYGSRSNVPDYMVWSGNTYRIVTDHLGSPRFVLEVAQGTLAEALTYDEFGNMLSDSNPRFQPFGFAGGLFDRDTGLTRFGARDYDAATGRWTAKDPVQFAGRDTDLYEYAFSDPVNFLDASGLATVTVGAGKGPAVFGSFGKDAGGNKTAEVKGGVGYGGGISYEPRGGLPKLKNESCPPRAFVGLSGFVELAIGPFVIGYGLKTGILAYSTTDGRLHVEGVGEYGPEFHFEMAEGWGLEAAAFAGADVGIAWGGANAQPEPPANPDPESNQ